MNSRAGGGGSSRCRGTRSFKRWQRSPWRPAPTLERTIKAQNPFIDVELFRTRLGEIEVQVCRIEVRQSRAPCSASGFPWADVS
jgi:hypothetical protein